MWDQEKKHLEKFSEILAESRVRPTALLPLWNVAGFALGWCSSWKCSFDFNTSASFHSLVCWCCFIKSERRASSVFKSIPGASTALLGKEWAMACTVAVEESISEHYNSQIRALMERDPERYTELLQVSPTRFSLKLLLVVHKWNLKQTVHGDAEDKEKYSNMFLVFMLWFD